MNLEISHNLLASQIRRRFPPREENRRRAEKMVRQNFSVHQARKKNGSKFWLDEKDLVFISPFLPELELSKPETAYVRRSRRKALIGAIWDRGKWLIWIGAALLALLLLTGGISIYEYQEIQRLTADGSSISIPPDPPPTPNKPPAPKVDTTRTAPPVNSNFGPQKSITITGRIPVRIVGEDTSIVDFIPVTLTDSVRIADSSPSTISITPENHHEINVKDLLRKPGESAESTPPTNNALQACNAKLDDLERNYLHKIQGLNTRIVSLNQRINQKDILIADFNRRNDSLQQNLLVCEESALDSLTKPVPKLVEQVNDLIRQLKYDEASDLMEGAGSWQSDKVIPNLLELAYFYLEAGEPQHAAPLLAEAQKIDPSRGGVSSAGQNPDSEQLRKDLQDLSRHHGHNLHEWRQRYYPSMVNVDGGKVVYYMRGNTGMEMPSDSLARPKNSVKATLNDFEIGKHEITAWQYNLYCRANHKSMPNPQPNWGWNGKHPAVNISWFDALEYANWLSKKQGKVPAYKLPQNGNSVSGVTINWDADGYRLPTEFEWQFAAAGGRKGKKEQAFSGSDDPLEVAWHEDNTFLPAGYNQTKEVGGKKSNELGIHDMSGNAWEWCWDKYDPGYFKKLAKSDTWHDNPKGPKTGENRVLHGGSYALSGKYSKIRFRGRSKPDKANRYDGFRLARNP